MQQWLRSAEKAALSKRFALIGLYF